MKEETLLQISPAMELMIRRKGIRRLAAAATDPDEEQRLMDQCDAILVEMEERGLSLTTEEAYGLMVH